MKDEPDIGLRCCSRCSKITSFSDEKDEVLSRETLFCRLGPRVSLDRTFLKTRRFYSNATPCIVSIQSEWAKLVIVNVHFEPELTVRRLRERPRLIVPHWPSYPNAVSFILGDFNVCDPEEGRFNVVNQTFTDGDTGKTASLHSNFPNILEIAQPDYTGTDSSASGIIRTLSRIDRIFVNVPMAEVRDLHCYSHVFENLGNRTTPNDHTAVRLVIQKPDNQGRQIKRTPGWMPKHPVFSFYSEATSRWPPIL